MSNDLPPHVAAARQFLSPEKAKAFEESCRRMRLRARLWDEGRLRDELKAPHDPETESKDDRPKASPK